MRMRKRQNLAPRMEACRSVWLEDAAYLRGNWRSLMPQARDIGMHLVVTRRTGGASRGMYDPLMRAMTGASSLK